MTNYTTGRHRYVRGPVTDSVKLKLIDRLQGEQDLELLADDIIEMIAVSRNDPDGFRAVNRELDRLASFDSNISTPITTDPIPITTAEVIEGFMYHSLAAGLTVIFSIFIFLSALILWYVAEFLGAWLGPL